MQPHLGLMARPLGWRHVAVVVPLTSGHRRPPVLQQRSQQRVWAAPGVATCNSEVF